MRRAASLLLCLAAACHEPRSEPGPSEAKAGTRLEQAARRAGLIATIGDPVGLYAAGMDRLCVVHDARGFGIGVLIDYDNDQGCHARGTLTLDGARATVALGKDCRFQARFEGDRIVFPAVIPESCDRQCSGHATLAALAAARLGSSESEAAGLRDKRGRPLCAS